MGVKKFLRNDPTLKQRRRELRRNQTDAERVLWAKVRNRQFVGIKFFRQYSIGPYIVDFYCPTVKLAVELDGGQHGQSDTKSYDAARSEYLRTHGIDVMRFWDNEVLLDIEGVLSNLALKVNLLSPLKVRGDEGGYRLGVEREVWRDLEFKGLKNGNPFSRHLNHRRRSGGAESGH